jgi:hypothetical protein
MVFENKYEHISVRFVKLRTSNLRGAWLLTNVINELENKRSIIRTSSKAIKEKYGDILFIY